MMGKALLFFLCLLTFSSFSQTQNQIGPRVWQDLLSLNRCVSVTRLGSNIYASNGVGVVWFDQAELSPQSLTKINGLNDVGVNLVRANPYNNKMLVLYQNCNIDVIDINQHITNYADFKLKVFNGKKTINEATFYKQYAYLACGFGIVQFDMDRLEVKETFVIGPAGSYLEVYQVALNDSLIFAATPNGIYKANYLTQNLNDYNSWKLVTAIPTGPYSGVVGVDGKIIAACSPHKLDPTKRQQDTLFVLKNNVWSKFDAGAYTLYKLCMTSGVLFSVVDDNGLKVVDVNAGNVNYITSFNGKTDILVNDAYFGKDHLSNLAYWVADLTYGLYQTYSYYPYAQQYPVRRNGINHAFINNIDVFNGNVALSPSHPDAGGGSPGLQEGLNIMTADGDWSYLKAADLAGAPVVDLSYVYFDRVDKTKMWAGSWFGGLLEYKNNKLIAVYNASNTPMSEAYPGSPQCGGMDQDSDGNLWFSNSDVSNYISVRKTNGTFQTFNFGSPNFTRRILVDKNNYVWAIHEADGGITVFNPTSYFNSPVAAPTANFNYRVLTKDVTNGNLQSNSIFCIAEDNDGKIWVGTGAGVVVFYNPTSIFNSSDFDAQPIKIVQNNTVELLLGSEVVSAIAVDGANNKWMGTQTGGVYCFSPDGITQLYHFTAENSPLYSNYVLDINYNATTGDVYFGTDLGLQSFRSIIVQGEEQYSNVFAYPNPVKPNYPGTVLIRGLMDNSIVTIADESGNIVWETKSYGGQVEWPITTFSHVRVKSGVYIVYASLTDASQKAVTKILVVN